MPQCQVVHTQSVLHISLILDSLQYFCVWVASIFHSVITTLCLLSEAKEKKLSLRTDLFMNTFGIYFIHKWFTHKRSGCLTGRQRDLDFHRRVLGARRAGNLMRRRCSGRFRGQLIRRKTCYGHLQHPGVLNFTALLPCSYTSGV